MQKLQDNYLGSLSWEWDHYYINNDTHESFDPYIRNEVFTEKISYNNDNYLNGLALFPENKISQQLDYNSSNYLNFSQNEVNSPNIVLSSIFYSANNVVDTSFINNDLEDKLLQSFDSNHLDDLGDISDIINSQNIPFENNVDVFQFIKEDFGNVDHYNLVNDLSFHNRTNFEDCKTMQSKVFTNLNGIYLNDHLTNFVLSRPVEVVSEELYVSQNIDNESCISSSNEDKQTNLDHDYIKHQHPPVNKIKRKREQNKLAATKYRQKIQKVKTNLELDFSKEEEKNIYFKKKIEDIEREIKYLKNLLKEIN